MKKIILLIFLTACSFHAEKNTLDIHYLKLNDLSHGEHQFSLSNNTKKELIK